MRRLASLFLLIALSFNTPNICAHALGADEPQAVSQEMMHDFVDHTQMRHDISQTEHDAPGEHSQHCPDGCEGGTDCQGCTAIPSAIFTSNDLGVPAVPDTLKTWAMVRPIHFSALLDPPPPKHLS